MSKCKQPEEAKSSHDVDHRVLQVKLPWDSKYLNHHSLKRRDALFSIWSHLLSPGRWWQTWCHRPCTGSSSPPRGSERGGSSSPPSLGGGSCTWENIGGGWIELKLKEEKTDASIYWKKWLIPQSKKITCYFKNNQNILVLTFLAWI